MRYRSIWLVVSLVLGLGVSGCAALASGETLPVEGRSATALAPDSAPPTPTQPPVGIQEGLVAPDFTLTGLTGQKLSLSDLRGQVVMLNFWAIWCGFCRIEIPEIQAAYEAYQNQGFVVLGIDVQEDAELVREFADGMGMTFPVLLDERAEVTLDYRVRGLPTSLFIDQNGVILAIHVGPLDKATIERYLAKVGVQ